MPPLTIALLRRLIRSSQYLVSIHAAEELEDDGLTVLDLENVLLTGQIIERQRDRVTHETKVVIRGQSLHGSSCCTVAKLGTTGRAIIITVYVEG